MARYSREFFGWQNARFPLVLAHSLRLEPRLYTDDAQKSRIEIRQGEPHDWTDRWTSGRRNRRRARRAYWRRILLFVIAMFRKGQA